MSARFRRPYATWLALVAVAVAIMAAPIPNFMTLRALAVAVRPSNSGRADQVAFVGNSVVAHVSKCDADKRTIPEMVAEGAHQPALDLSVSGQPIDMSIGLAALALETKNVRSVVFYIALPALQGRFGYNIQTTAFFRLLDGSLHAADVDERLRHFPIFSAVPGTSSNAFTYGNKSYPDYTGLEAIYFDDELRNMACPETMGRDARFIEANYWHVYLAAPADATNIDDLLTLQRRAHALHKKILFVVLPVDIEDVSRLNLRLGVALKVLAARQVRDLRKAGLSLVDLSTGVAASSFADRWCACGHMTERGRKYVAGQTVLGLKQASER